MKIAISTSSFASIDTTPLELLEANRLQVVSNPFGRKMNEEEIINHLQGVDGLLAGLEPLRNRMRMQLEKVWAGTSIKNISVVDFEKALSRDKKNIGNTYQLILTRGIGNMMMHGIMPGQEFTGWLNDYFSTQLGS